MTNLCWFSTNTIQPPEAVTRLPSHPSELHTVCFSARLFAIRVWFFIFSSALLLKRNKDCALSHTGGIPEQLLTSQVLSPSLNFPCALTLHFVMWCTLKWSHLAPHCFACSLPKSPLCLPQALLTAVSWQHTCLWLSWVFWVLACLQVKTWKSMMSCDLRNQEAAASPWCSLLLTSKVTLALVLPALHFYLFPPCYIKKPSFFQQSLLSPLGPSKIMFSWKVICLGDLLCVIRCILADSSEFMQTNIFHQTMQN